MAEDDEKTKSQKIKARMKLAKTATLNQLDLAKMGLMKMTSKGNLYEPSTKGLVKFEGFLFKKSPGGIPLMRHWHKRWFVLESPGKLLYYTDSDKNELKGIIPLDMIEKMLFRATRLTLLMEGASENAPPRKFSLKGDSDTVVKKWGEAINKAFEELDQLEDEEDQDHKIETIGEADSKYWKVETRKKLNLSVALEDKPKKKKPATLKIDPRAKEIEAQIAEREAAEHKHSDAPVAAGSPQNASAGYMPLNDDGVVPEPSQERQQAEQEEHDRLERQKTRELQEEADLAAAIAASQIEHSQSSVESLEG